MVWNISRFFDNIQKILLPLQLSSRLMLCVITYDNKSWIANLGAYFSVSGTPRSALTVHDMVFASESTDLARAHEVAHEAAAQHGQRVLVQLHAAARHRLHQHLPAGQRVLQQPYVLLLYPIAIRYIHIWIFVGKVGLIFKKIVCKLSFA